MGAYWEGGGRLIKLFAMDHGGLLEGEGLKRGWGLIRGNSVNEYTSTRVHEYTSTRVHEYTSTRVNES